MKNEKDLSAGGSHQTSGSMAENLLPPDDSGRASKIGLWALGLGFGGFLLWAAI